MDQYGEISFGGVNSALRKDKFRVHNPSPSLGRFLRRRVTSTPHQHKIIQPPPINSPVLVEDNYAAMQYLPRRCGVLLDP